MELREFFSWVNEDIRKAKTEGALESLRKRVAHYYRDNLFRKGVSKIVSRLNKIINRKIRQLRRRR